MRYIQKNDKPQFFIDATNELSNWDEYYASKKRKLKKYILDNEQNCLCCYCEGKVNRDNSHLEHIKPKSLDTKNLTFNYDNISVSCNGVCKSGEEKKYCGHKKQNDFNEDKFLNPTTLENIREYFKYDINGEIKPSSLDSDKSEYTINLLQLNPKNNYLQEARKKALQHFRKTVQNNTKSVEEMKLVIKKLLDKENLPYISYLRYHYVK